MSPSDLEDLYELKTWCDLRHKVQLRLALDQAKVMQDYQTMALILSAAFGGKKGEPSGDGERPEAPDAKGGVFIPKDFADLQRAFKNVVTGGG